MQKAEHKIEMHAAPPRKSLEALHWYAVQTVPRHEKRVQERLEFRGIHCFLPVYTKMSRWKNGVTARVELPLFPTYLFVELAAEARGSVLVDPGVSRLVGSGREAIAVPRAEIEALQQAALLGQLQPHDYLVAGERVRIRRGPLADLTGILVRKNNDLRLVLKLDLIRQGASVEVAIEDVEAVVAEAVRG
jgi:transcription antitermination factor NusG